MAELGFVGDGPNSYQIWLGGSTNATRLAEPFAERVKSKVSGGGVWPGGLRRGSKGAGTTTSAQAAAQAPALAPSLRRACPWLPAEAVHRVYHAPAALSRAFGSPPLCGIPTPLPCPSAWPSPPGVLQDFETFFEPVFAMFAAQRRNGESLGDFTARVGFDAVRAFQASYIAPAVAEKLPKVSSSPPPDPHVQVAVSCIQISLVNWKRLSAAHPQLALGMGCTAHPPGPALGPSPHSAVIPRNDAESAIDPPPRPGGAGGLG